MNLRVLRASQAAKHLSKLLSSFRTLNARIEAGLDVERLPASELRQARILNRMLVAALVLCPVLGAFWALFSSPRFIPIYAVAFVAWAAILGWIRTPGRIQFGGRAACLVYYGLSLSSSIMLGGLHSHSMAWMLVLPVAAVVCVGIDDLWAWCGFSIVSVGVLAAVTSLGTDFSRADGSEGGILAAAMSLVLGIVVVGILMTVWNSFQSELEWRLDESVKRLEDEARANRLIVEVAMALGGETNLESGVRIVLWPVASAFELSRIVYWKRVAPSDEFKALDHYPSEIAPRSSPALGEVRRTRQPVAEEADDLGVLWLPVVVDGEVVGVVEAQASDDSPSLVEYEWALGQVAGQFQHIAEREQAANAIWHEAHHDHLTCLSNRRAFQGVIESRIEDAEREGDPLALLFVDLNGFKRINDSLGHSSGDEVLRIVAKRLRKSVRLSDSLCHRTSRSAEASLSRVGGDEFTLILSEVGEPELADIAAERIIKSLEEPIFVANREVKVGASIGIAVYPDDATTREGLVQCADAAMYIAKRRGTSGYARYRSDAVSLDLIAFESDVRCAIAEDQLVIHFQPAFECRTGQCVGVEALIRWRHPSRGWIPPSDFIPQAEAAGLMRELGRFQFEASIAWFEASHASMPEGFRLALNLSPRQIEDADFVEWLIERFGNLSFPLRQIDLEITETALLSDTPEVQAHIARLAEMGLCIALDDFGTGQSSLSLLKRFPIGRLKIDRSFVGGLPDRAEDVAIVSAVLSLGRALAIPIVAEGVEDEAQQEFLAERGCDEMQGFLLARPMPGDEVIRRFGRDAK